MYCFSETSKCRLLFILLYLLAIDLSCSMVRLDMPFSPSFSLDYKDHHMPSIEFQCFLFLSSQLISSKIAAPAFLSCSVTFLLQKLLLNQIAQLSLDILAFN